MKKKLNEFGKKLEKALLDKNLSRENLAKKLGITVAMISNWTTGYRNPSLTSIKKIAKTLNLPLDYFLNEESINFIADIADPKSIRSINPNNIIRLPVVASAQCGKPDFCTFDEKIYEDFINVPVDLFQGASFIIKCQGYSMLPEIAPDAYCIIQKLDVPLINKNMLIKTKDGYTIKRVKKIKGKVEFCYLNPDGKILEAENVEIIGKVMGAITKF